MRVKTYSYRYAEEILQHPKYRDIYDELMGIFTNCPVPVYEGKSKNQEQKDVVQQLMNTYFYEAFINQGWETEVLASPEEFEDALKSDFRKTFNREGNENITVQIEVEFGNVASSYRNYFKFQLSFSYGMTDLCVLVVPSAKLSNRIDSGVSNFEKVLREIPTAKLSITVPILVVGLFDEDDQGNQVDVWNIKDENISLDIAKSSYSPEHHEVVIKYLKDIGKYIE